MMGKYIVTVLITNEPREKELTIYAPTENEAERKARDLVLGWDGVADAEVTDIEEAD
jgi:hypothetical protein